MLQGVCSLQHPARQLSIANMQEDKGINLLVEFTAEGAHRGRKGPSATQTNKRQRLAQTARCAKGTRSKPESPRVQRPNSDRKSTVQQRIALPSFQLLLLHLLGMQTTKQVRLSVMQSK